MPGQYDRKAANAVSSNRPKIRMRFLQEGDRQLVRTPLWSECVIAGEKVFSAGCEQKSIEHSLHALLQDGVPPGFADDEISPLDDDDAGEESRMAGVLYNFPALVRLDGKK